MYDTDRAAFTIAEFCFRNHLSKPLYYKERDLGRGPKEMRIGTSVRITVAAEREWQRLRENPEGEEKAEIAATAGAMRERAVKAVAKSVASPHHISRRRGRAETAA
jgi:hypothetical protein